MKNTKSKIFKIVSIILAIILAFVLCFGGYLLYRFNCDKSNATNSYSDIYSQEQITLDVADDGIFSILKINDTHFFNGTCEDDKKTLDSIKSILDTTPCDLIIIDGDLVEGFNLKASYDKFQAIDLFAQLIESYNIPWTFAPGNNDGEIDGDNEDIIAFMMQYDNFIYGNEEGIDGSMQFFINLNYQDNLVHSIAIMDSGMRKPKAIGSYQPISENQIQWLIDGVNERQVKTSVFFHMETNAFQTAYDNGEAYDGFTMYNTYAYDNIKGDELFDNMTADNEYISLISCAHQHSNNMCSYYNGRYYQLSSAGGYSAGRQDFITPSCTLTTINVNENDTQNMYTFKQITVQ
jgi:hypothetical protein